MEGLKKLIPNISKETKLGSSSPLLSEPPYLGAGGGGGGVSAALSSSSDQSHVLVTRAPRYFFFLSFLFRRVLIFTLRIFCGFVFHWRTYVSFYISSMLSLIAG